MGKTCVVGGREDWRGPAAPPAGVFGKGQDQAGSWVSIREGDVRDPAADLDEAIARVWASWSRITTVTRVPGPSRVSVVVTVRPCLVSPLTCSRYTRRGGGAA